MTVASFLLAPLADVFGPAQHGAGPFLALITAGLFLTAAAPSLGLLIGARFVTGLGIGAILASLNTLVAEYSSEERRNFALSFMHLGFTAGSIIAGLIAVGIIGAYGWRSIFIVAGAASAAMIPVVYLGLPESVDFLLTKQPRNALKRANRILARIGRPRLTSLPDKPRAEEKTRFANVFAQHARLSTFALWGGFFCAFGTLFFFQNWLPTIITQAGLTLSGGHIREHFLQCRRGGRHAAAGSFLDAPGALENDQVVLLRVHARHHRAIVRRESARPDHRTGDGDRILRLRLHRGALRDSRANLPCPRSHYRGGLGPIGIGRIGSTVSPAFAGLLFAAGWSSSGVYWIYAVPQMLGLLLMLLIALSAPPANPGGLARQPT